VAQHLYFAFRHDEVLVREDAASSPWPTQAEVLAAGAREAEAHEVGALEGARFFALALDREAEAPPGFTFVGLRALFVRVREEEWYVAGRALQVLEWDRTSRFCGACATPTAPVPGERARRCPACGLSAYPRIAPAIIVLVERGDEALLAKPQRLPMIYSTLAGFVEPGETLEQTLAREVEEEVGLKVEAPRYFGSQPWPFPHSLMIGFHATYAGGELRVDGQEVLEAGWFRYDALPNIPPRISIARALIDDWVARRAAATPSRG
jgi:NAD+ diphosphatase